MQYVEPLYRPPSEAQSFILQATIGCSWNKCTYCDMYRQKTFRVRPVEDSIADIREMAAVAGPQVRKVFVADGDALILGLDEWLPILDECRRSFPNLRQVSCYATAINILEKTPDELRTLHDHGLTLFYVGPESGDDATLRRIAKGSDFQAHVDAATAAREASIRLSAIFLLGAGGRARSREHATESARLATAMDPLFLSALTLTVIPGTPLARLEEKGGFELPEVDDLLQELRTFVAEANPTDAIFRTNHASNYLAIGGRLPRDRDAIVAAIDDALRGDRPLRDDSWRGL
ncbi:MAG: radical SAM protein [Planctomycetota bacterium]